MTTPATYTYRFSSKHGEIDLTGTAPVPLVVAVLGARDCEMTPVVTQPEPIALHAATKPARKPRAVKVAKAAPKAPSMPAKAPKPAKAATDKAEPVKRARKAASAVDGGATNAAVSVVLTRASEPLSIAEIVARIEGSTSEQIKAVLARLPGVVKSGKARGTRYGLAPVTATTPPMGEHGAEV